MDALAVAADITAREGDAVDLAVPEEFAEVARLGGAVGRVVPIPAPVKPETKAPESGGWRERLAQKALNVAGAVAQNIAEYKVIGKALRENQYDVVFDLDGTPFGVAVARAAKADKIIGFSPESLENPMPGLNLAYHDTRTVRGKLSPAAKCRTLLARFFNTGMEPTQWRLTAAAQPANERAGILTGGNIPPPFADALRQSAGAETIAAADDNPARAPELAREVGGCAIVVGNGLATALGAALGVPVCFVGAKKDAPEKAAVAETPAALAAAVENFLSQHSATVAAASVAVAQTAKTNDGDGNDGDDRDGGDGNNNSDQSKNNLRLK